MALARGIARGAQISQPFASDGRLGVDGPIGAQDDFIQGRGGGLVYRRVHSGLVLRGNTFSGPTEAERVFHFLFASGMLACGILHPIIGYGLKSAAAR